MIHLNKYLNNKNLIIISSIVLFSIILLIILFTFKVNKTTSAILEVDKDKNLFIRFQTINVSSFSNVKDMMIKIDNKMYLLNDVEFIYQGQNKYIVNFTNDYLYHLLKTNSIYEVQIISSVKTIFQIMFNI